MLKVNANNFTWGFEIEGAFSDKCWNIVKKYQDVEFDTKEDGSVSASVDGDCDVMEYNTEDDERNCDCDGDCDCERNGRYEVVSEISVGVFKSFNKMLQCLGEFKNGNNYFMNSTCGLHIHIKPKKGFEYLRGQLFDYHFIKLIQLFAENEMGETIKSRIQRQNSWCATDYGFRSLLRRYGQKVKYSFMGNHPQGTIEFRFFSPENGKVQQIEKFFDYFFNTFNGLEKEKRKNIILENDNVKSLDDIFTTHRIPAKISLNVEV